MEEKGKNTRRINGSNIINAKDDNVGGDSRMKKTIVSGVYLIQCMENGRNYIGSSKDIYRRWSTHKKDLEKGVHHNIYLQEDWSRFGCDKFSFDILLECSLSDARKYEVEYIEKFKSEKFGYNVKGLKKATNKRHNIIEGYIVDYIKNNGYCSDGELYYYDIFDVANYTNVNMIDLLKFFNVNQSKSWNVSYMVNDDLYIGITTNTEGVLLIAYNGELINQSII